MIEKFGATPHQTQLTASARHDYFCRLSSLDQGNHGSLVGPWENSFPRGQGRLCAGALNLLSVGPVKYHSRS